MSEDKWNPADIIAIKTSEVSRIMSLLKNFKSTSKVIKGICCHRKDKIKNSKRMIRFV